MKSDNGQSLVLIGISFIVLAVVLVYIAFSQPKISNSSYNSSGNTSQYSESATVIQSNNAVVSNTEVSGKTEKTLKESSTAVNSSFPINLNTATVEELKLIDGIGDTRAQSIIAYRDQIGSYTSVKQITEIKGIGDSLYAKVSPYLTVE